MVKESERRRAYHPRGPHKEGCLCSVCKVKGRKAVGVVVAEEEKLVLVPVSSVPAGRKIEYGGKLYKKVNVNCDRESLCLRLVTEGNEQFVVPNDRIVLSADTPVVEK